MTFLLNILNKSFVLVAIYYCILAFMAVVLAGMFDSVVFGIIYFLFWAITTPVVLFLEQRAREKIKHDNK